MDKSKCKEFVDAYMPKVFTMLGLSEWRVQTIYQSGLDAKMQIHLAELLSYQKAKLIINHEAFDDEESILESLRHEGIHVLLAPFTQAMYTAGMAIKDPVLTDVLNEVYRHHEEELVRNLERFIDTLEVWNELKSLAS